MVRARDFGEYTRCINAAAGLEWLPCIYSLIACLVKSDDDSGQAETADQKIKPIEVNKNLEILSMPDLVPAIYVTIFSFLTSNYYIRLKPFFGGW